MRSNLDLSWCISLIFFPAYAFCVSCSFSYPIFTNCVVIYAVSYRRVCTPALICACICIMIFEISMTGNITFILNSFQSWLCLCAAPCLCATTFLMLRQRSLCFESTCIQNAKWRFYTRGFLLWQVSCMKRSGGGIKYFKHGTTLSSLVLFITWFSSTYLCYFCLVLAWYNTCKLLFLQDKAIVLNIVWGSMPQFL